MSKNKLSGSGIVYSTDPKFMMQETPEKSTETLPPAEQKLHIKLETKHRAGKAVTLIEGFVGTTVDKEALGKQLKNFCGTGGSVKDGEILVQGDHRDKIRQWLLKNGFKCTGK